ncbi:MAG: winged helix-turn-helix transcriptional regulator [Elusimicrobia bacterium]|nr:winged helix-turn-helix transcriptional regulator [Candidatus Obscuribacterium magneticum]
MAELHIEDKSHRVLNLLARDPHLSQRELASNTGLSLGLINLIIKRLIKTGYLKVLNLNSNKAKYLLTKKGMLEKTNRTASYISQTINTFKTYKSRIDELVQELVKNGHKSFVILGEGEVASLLEMSLRSAPGITYRHASFDVLPQDGEIVLDCRLNTEKGQIGISILNQLLQEKESISTEKQAPMETTLSQ